MIVTLSPQISRKQALVIGAGPAGLMAAEVLARAGHAVHLADQMPSFGRKMLMAGKSGLNLTNDKPLDIFVSAYHPANPALTTALRAFGPAEVCAWAEGLGQTLFTGSSGRVFPVGMKASPLLRAWLARLEALGVTFARRWRWTGWHGDVAQFSTPEGMVAFPADAVVLALGGGSWKRLGSDGTWTSHFADGDIAPFQPANMGFVVDWSPHMARYFGSPLKGMAIKAGARSVRAECVISARGLEGGGIYTVSRDLREGADLRFDLFPDLSLADLRARIASVPAGSSMATLFKRLKLDPARAALVQEFGRPFPADLAPLLKDLPIRLSGPRPLDEAISTAGGLRAVALDGFMLRARPGVFAAGEMLDWEAPTGGYLLTGCFATGHAAGLQAADYLSGR